MFTGTPAELRDRERRARRLAEQIADLLNKVNDLDIGPAMGNLIIPGVDIRNTGSRWTVR
jgi:hypothetical protein